MLYLIGLGLGDAKDITVKGLEIVKRVEKVYLENYTSILCCGQKELEEFYGRSLILVNRQMMECGTDEILDAAIKGDTAVLVVGDPLNATTHTDLLTRAASRSIPFRIIHNASIINAVACCGLQMYNFGETVSIPFWTDTWKPESFYDKITHNMRNKAHTLCLLDIKVEEPNLELMVQGIHKMDPPRFMSVSQAAQQLLDIIKRRTSSGDHGRECDIYENTICVGLARVGSSTQKIVKTTLAEATKLDLGPPLHSLVLVSCLQPLENDMLNIMSR